MAHEPEEALPPDEEGGGPVKSFLDHLEDLRWTIIRCVAALAISMILCLVAGSYIVTALKYPLERAYKSHVGTNQTISILAGGKQLFEFQPGTNRLGMLHLGDKQHVAFELETIPLGTNQIVVLKYVDVPPELEAEKTMVKLKTFGPLSGFMVAFQLAFYGGIGLSSPFLLYFIAQFVFPALKRTEKKFIQSALGLGIGLFITGALFCYFLLLPVTLEASVMYAEWQGFTSEDWRAEEYISFVCKFMLAMGVAFELPIIILTMVKIGFLDYAKLAKFRPYFVIVNLVLSAFLTPGADPLSMVLMAVPLQVLYEISVWIAWYWDRKARRNAVEIIPPR